MVDYRDGEHPSRPDPVGLGSDWVIPGVPRQSTIGSDEVSGPPGSSERVVGPLGEAFATITSSLDEVLTGLGTATVEQVQEVLVAVHALSNRVEGLRLNVVRELWSREPVAKNGKRSTAGVRGVSDDRCRRGRGQTSVDLLNTELTDPTTGQFSMFGKALQAGDVSRDHLAPLRGVLRRVPQHLLQEHRDRIDHVLTSAAKVLSPDAFARVVDAMVTTLNPGDGYDPHASERRYLKVAQDAYGMFQLSGQVPADTGLLVQSVLDKLVALDRARHETVDEEGRPVPDPLDIRSTSQRYADALGVMAQLAGEHLALVLDPATNLPVQEGPGGALNHKPARSAPHITLSAHDDSHPDNDPGKEATSNDKADRRISPTSRANMNSRTSRISRARPTS